MIPAVFIASGGRPDRRWARALARCAVALAVLATTAGPAAAEAPPRGVCPDVSFVGARGSGQESKKATRGIGPELWHMAQRLEAAIERDGETLRTLPIAYEAEGVERLSPSKRQLGLLAAGRVEAAVTAWYRNNFRAYIDSIDEGIELTKQALRTSTANCPDTDFVMAGYSQGAMVMHQAQLQLDAAGEDDVLGAVAGTLLLGDGDKVPNTRAKRFGDAPGKAQGVRSYAPGGAADVLDPELTADICDKGDIVCDFNVRRLRHFGSAKKTHSSYLARDRVKVLDAAVDWLASEF